MGPFRLPMLGEHNVDGLVIIGSSEHAATTNRMLADGTAIVNVIRAPADSAIERRSSLCRKRSVCASSSAVRAATRASSSLFSTSSWRVLR